MSRRIATRVPSAAKASAQARSTRPPAAWPSIAACGRRHGNDTNDTRPPRPSSALDALLRADELAARQQADRDIAAVLARRPPPPALRLRQVGGASRRRHSRDAGAVPTPRVDGNSSPEPRTRSSPCDADLVRFGEQADRNQGCWRSNGGTATRRVAPLRRLCCCAQLCASWYAVITAAGIRPAALTCIPWSRAHARTTSAWPAGAALDPTV